MQAAVVSQVSSSSLRVRSHLDTDHVPLRKASPLLNHPPPSLRPGSSSRGPAIAMPRPDNLYSAVNSDEDSFSEELSPSDGYFNGRGSGMPTNALVQDPTCPLDSKPEPKTLMPTPYQQRSTGSTSRSSIHAVTPGTTPSHTDTYASGHNGDESSHGHSRHSSSYAPHISLQRRDEILDDHSTMINGPPPAYSLSPHIPPPTSPELQPPHPQPIHHQAPQSQSYIPSPQAPQILHPTPQSPQSPQHHDQQAYSTFPEQHLERGYLPRGEPESMGGPIETTPTESTPLSGNARKTNHHKGRKQIRKITKKILSGSLILAVLITLLTMWWHSSSDHGSHGGDGVQVPDEGNDIDTDRPIDSSGPYCPSAKFAEDQVTYEFPVGRELSVLQTTYGEASSGTHDPVSTVGEVRLRRIPKNSKHGKRPFFTVDIHVSDPSLEVVKTWDEPSRQLVISTPRLGQFSDRKIRHCVSVELTAWLPEDSKFVSITIDTVSLTLRVLPDIKIDVAGQAKFRSISGRVYFPAADKIDCEEALDADGGFPLTARRVVVETTSGSIRGAYPLMDYLGLSSESGSIQVDVFPKSVLESAPAPADLEVHTSSGSISINCPVPDPAVMAKFNPPPRNYVTNLHSNSGSMKGSFYVGSISNFKTNSASIQIKALPVLQTESVMYPATPRNVFETVTNSGSIRVEVLDPFFIEPQSPNPIQLTPGKPRKVIGDIDPYKNLLPPNPDLNVDSLPFLQSRSQRSRYVTPLFVASNLTTLGALPQFDSLRSNHGSTSATVAVNYPPSWVGTMHARTVSGSISAKGDGLRIVRERKGFANKELVVRKGDDDDPAHGCEVGMNDIAGSLLFYVGTLDGGNW